MTTREQYLTDGGSREYCCKIARVAGDYSLTNLDDELIDRRSDQDASLRELAAYVNDRLISAVITTADVDIAADPAQVRSVIRDSPQTDTDLSVTERERIATILDRNEVDIDSLRKQFVSHETVRTHLNDHLEVDTSHEPSASSIEDTRAMIASIRNRDTSIIERALYALRRDDQIESGPVETALTVQVTCSACGRTNSVDEFLDNRGCSCTDERPEAGGE